MMAFQRFSMKSLFLLSLLTPSLGALYDKASSLPGTTYDYIIVGGGTAGAILANRLTEDDSLSVLLIEAGPSHEGAIELQIPYDARIASPGTIWDWNYTTTPQHAVNNRRIVYPRGRVLGGSSSINYMFYTRGSAEDYDRLAEVVQDDRFSWESLLPYFKKGESIVPATESRTSPLLIQDGAMQSVHDDDAWTKYNPKFHGTDGPIGVSSPGYSQPIDWRILETTKELSDEFPFLLDHNAGSPVGVSWVQNTIRNGTRESTATGYLSPRDISRENLHVLVNAVVSRVLSFTGSNVIDTVEFSQPGLDDTSSYVSASVEVILSAGSIGTPHILLNSGIGDSRELEDIGIPVMADVKGVGKNMSDHPWVPTAAWHVSSEDTFDVLGYNQSAKDEAMEQWTDSRTGRYINGVANHVAWNKLNASNPEVAAMLKRYGDPAPGPNSPHFEFIIYNFGLQVKDRSRNYFTLAPILLTPKSRGSVRLDPMDPLGAPIIDTAFYDSPFDLFAVRQGMLAIMRFASASVWSGYLEGGADDFEQVLRVSGKDTDALDEYIRAHTETLCHPVGTAMMSPYGADWGVVDPDFHVKGLKGLRVVDASIFPYVVAAATQASVFGIAERAADIIREDFAALTHKI